MSRADKILRDIQANKPLLPLAINSKRDLIAANVDGKWRVVVAKTILGDDSWEQCSGLPRVNGQDMEEGQVWHEYRAPCRLARLIVAEGGPAVECLYDRVDDCDWYRLFDGDGEMLTEGGEHEVMERLRGIAQENAVIVQ